MSGCGGACSCKSKSGVLVPSDDSSIVSIKTKVGNVRRHLMLTNALTKATRDMLVNIEDDLTDYKK